MHPGGAMKTLLMLVLIAGCAKADPPVQPKPVDSAAKTTGADVRDSKRDAGLVPPLTVPPEMGTVQTR